jgi:hypothetical protein
MIPPSLLVHLREEQRGSVHMCAREGAPPPENTIGLVCRVPRARGLTRLILLFCVRVGRAKETNSLHPSSGPEILLAVVQYTLRGKNEAPIEGM